MKTRKEVEELKTNWYNDPIFDLADYYTDPEWSEYKDELMEFEKKSNETWNTKTENHRKELSSKLCPMRFSAAMELSMYCQLEECAWWNSTQEKCAIAFLPHLMDLAAKGDL